ncbi:hypothetical protein Rhal01_00039 [Rubritalea halochordaticola]|uniref:PepSY-associated TM helix domain-containing protein n=1 Tax=Rubritalea halochordaticola TaxID=714537 RepID=A0ABP9UU61_9BACT
MKEEESTREPNQQERRKKNRRKAFWTKQFYLWHWVSSAICLAAMLLFAVTGITLNHAADIKVEPKVTEKTLQVPSELRSALSLKGEDDFKAPLPEDLAKWLTKELGTPLKKKEAEWSEYEIYLSLPRPGGDAWLLIDRETHEVTYELTDRGTLSFLNDLHKGRHTGAAWSWFLDIFSAACIIFCLTGLGLLFVHAKRRPTTWPVVIAGILIPLILILFFIH